MTLYWDASALSAILLQDEGYETIERWIAGGIPTSSLSDLTWGEFVSAASMRVRSGRLDDAGGHLAVAIAGRFVADWTRLSLNAGDVDAAAALVARFDLRLRLPDAIHVAIALRAGAMLVTTDRVQREAARAVGLSVHDPLEDHA